MLRNYILIAWRNLLRNRRYSLLNLLGLSTGLACFMLIGLYLLDEMSYDQFHTDADRIYRLVEKIDLNGQGEISSSNPFPVGPTIATEHPQYVEQVVRFFDMQLEKHTLAYEDQKLLAEEVFFVDPNVFEVFDFELLHADPKSVLQDTGAIVLTEQLAVELFGDASLAIGQTIRFEDKVDLKVTGLMKAVREQSHFHPSALISIHTLEKIYYSAHKSLWTNWQWNPAWTYLLLKEGVEVQALESVFPQFVQAHYPEWLRDQVTHSLQPISSIHLDSHLDYEIEPNSNRSNLYLFSLIGILILLIACINFMNLATARSTHRAREVGLRKVIGAFQGQLIRQFLGESILVSLVGAFFSLLMASLLLPFFDSVSGKDFSQADLLTPGFLLGLLGVSLLVGLVSGLYPAFYLSSFQPVSVIKGRMRLRLGDRLFRKGLVLTQFIISLILVISTLTIWQQYKYMRDADLGFQKDQIVVIPTKLFMGPDKLDEYRQKMCSRPGIESTTMMNEVLGIHHNIHEYFYRQGQDTVMVFYPSLLVDRDFVETFKLKLIAGKDFSYADRDDATRSVLVNREFIDQRGWCPQEAIGKLFSTYKGEERIKGVLENFHFVSVRDSIQPFVLDIANNERSQYFFGRYIAVRISGRDEKTVRKSIAYLRAHWEQIVPNHPFDYFFLDSKIDKLYEREDQLTSLVAYFSCLALIIACLGLFALAAYTAEQRTKEIGIRKVLGATDILIARTMAKEFVQLILLALPLGWLVSGLFMSDWLQSFAEPVTLSPLIFLLASGVVMGIALTTVMLHAFRAANANPVTALRDE